jgi:hypothetical protein
MHSTSAGTDAQMSSKSQCTRLEFSLSANRPHNHRLLERGI